MRSHRTLLALAALAVAISGPVQAKVLATGKPSKGYFWQKVEKSNGQTSLMCRATNSSKIQPATACTAAGAKQP